MNGVVIARVNLSPLMVTQLIEALETEGVEVTRLECIPGRPQASQSPLFERYGRQYGIDPLALYDVRISVSDPALGGMVPTLKSIGGTRSDSNGDPNLVPGFATATLRA